MGVNDLAKQYEQECAARTNCEPYVNRGRRCPDCPVEDAQGIRAIARESWHPVSEPPTEADGDRNHSVFVRHGGGDFSMQDVQVYRKHAPEGTKWARVSDVLLLPEGD